MKEFGTGNITLGTELVYKAEAQSCNKLHQDAEYKGLLFITTKVVVQMNCEVEGEVWAVKITTMNGYITYH